MGKPKGHVSTHRLAMTADVFGLRFLRSLRSDLAARFAAWL